MYFVLMVVLAAVLASDPPPSTCPLRIVNKSDYSLYRKLQWLRPNVTASTEALADGAHVEVRCDTGFLQDHLISRSYNLRCTNGSFNGSLRLDDFLCRSRHQANTTIYRKPCSVFGILSCVGKNLIAYEIGSLGGRGCARILYAVCVDASDMRTKFGYQHVVRAAGKRAAKVGCKKGTWGFDGYGRGVEEKKFLSKAYYQKYQKSRLASLFPDRYGRKKPYPYYFNRGHIVPSGDFEECEQAATYEYVNLAPQWEVLNRASWNAIEDEARNAVRNATWEWVVYTGTYGKIPTPRGLMYLVPKFDENGNFKKGYVPVPMLYWKIVYNKCDASKSLVYIGVNNPEFKSFEEIHPRYVVCKPIRDRKNRYFIGSEFKGFVYRCELDEFLRKLSRDEGIVVESPDRPNCWRLYTRQ